MEPFRSVIWRVLTPWPPRPGDGILVERGALAVTGFGDHQEFAARVGSLHGHDLVAFAQGYALDAGGRAAHGTHVGYVKANRLSVTGDDDQVLVARGQFDADQFVAVAQVEGDNALPEMLE